MDRPDVKDIDSIMVNDETLTIEVRDKNGYMFWSREYDDKIIMHEDLYKINYSWLRYLENNVNDIDKV